MSDVETQNLPTENSVFDNKAHVEKQNLPTGESMFDNITHVEMDFSKYVEEETSFNHKITKTSARSVVLTIFNIFRSFVAIGILTLPYAVSLVGPVIAISAQIIVAVLIYLCIRLVVEVADDSRFKGSNYETLGKLLWGNKGKNVILIALYICSIATFMGGVLFTADFLDFAFCDHLKICGSKTTYLFSAFIVSVLISFIQSLKPFGYISLASTFIIILSLMSITIYNFNYIATTEEDLTSRIGNFQINHFFSFLGIALYTTEGIGLVLPIRSSFGDNKNFSKVFGGTYIFIIWFYIMMGVFSYIVS